MDTKIFSTEDIGKLPSSLGGGNLTTYKELCSLASDMGQPEMIYQFMHLSNHSAIWSDRIGAAFGVGNLVKCAGEELQPYLGSIIPRIYRYQYDPNLKVQQSMSNIWSVMVARPKETVDKYLEEIIKDLKSNIHSRMWRTRESCSNALGDLVRTRTHNDVILAEMPEFWELVLKIMDDIKESVRKSAAKTSEVLSKASISACNIDHGARGARAISTILPVLLDKGITSTLVEVQTISIVTVMKISENAGKLISPHVDVIIPAFIVASANIEPKAFGQVTTMVSGNTEDKDKMEAARAALALSSPLISVIEKCVRCVDDAQLETLVAKLASLARSSVGLTPRVTLLHTVSLLAVYQQQDLTKWVGKLMGAMFVVLPDRSPAVRDKCAATVAVLFRYAKPSTVDNVLEKLRSWYLEKEDTVKNLVAVVLNKIANSASDVLRTVHGAVIPLSLFGKHSKEGTERELWEMVWLELGVSDQSVVLLHLAEISSLCSLSLGTTSWTNRIQAADTLATVATVLASSYPPPQLCANVELLMEATTGRTFPGKSAILAALAKSLTAPKRSNLSDVGVEEEKVMTVFLREVRKKDAEYVSQVMRSLGDVLLGVQVSDCWEDLWDICCTHLVPPEEKEDEEEESKEKRKKTETFTIQTVTQESAVLLLGVGWRVCRNKPDKIVQLSEFLAGIMRICTWKIQLSVLCSIQHVLQSLGTTPETSSSAALFTEELKMSVYQSVIPGVLRCVDDTKHTTVRALALKLTAKIFESSLSAGMRLKTEIVKDVLLHVRDQVALKVIIT